MAAESMKVHYGDLTWELYCLKSLDIRLFVQQLVQVKNKENIKLTSKGNALVIGGFPAWRAGNADNTSLLWCHHVEWREMVYFKPLMHTIHPGSELPENSN